tara:strand:+ start:249 stop:512 length:264 start_codon:yes stop_codon:yes gene_type:complete
MLPTGNGGSAPVYGHALGHVTHERYRPEHTLLYQLIEKHYPALVEQLDAQGRSLPTRSATHTKKPVFEATALQPSQISKMAENPSID